MSSRSSVVPGEGERQDLAIREIGDHDYEQTLDSMSPALGTARDHMRKTVMTMNAQITQAKSKIPVVSLGLSLCVFLAISYVLCILLGLVWSSPGLHQPWLQFLPGFTWLTWPSFFLGLAESLAYGWYIALVFAPLFNFFAGQRR